MVIMNLEGKKLFLELGDLWAVLSTNRGYFLFKRPQIEGSGFKTTFCVSLPLCYYKVASFSGVEMLRNGRSEKGKETKEG